ncbi:MAG TPA: PA2169 family four-helix-bundle protein [Methylomirabilota bacterium]|jgi:uncharacterized protein (TIGR02284 family)
MALKEAISTLNDLIETCKDGEQGFTTAADAIRDPAVKQLFLGYAQQRSQFSAELQRQVSALGGEPERSGSVTASLHRGWINLKSAVTGQNDASVIAAAEEGEDVAKTSYEKALRAELTPDVRRLVERQYAGVKDAHDRVRALKQRAA